MKKLLLSVLLLSNFCAFVFGQERLILIGGGERSDAVLTRFAEWTGNEKSKILVITWASGVPQESFDAFKSDFEKVSKITLENAPLRPLDEAAKVKFLQQLKEANGVFFTGGDQNRVMEVLQDASLLKALQEKYKNGTVFAGTSAGTAIMSQMMITGEGDFTVIDAGKVETKNGLGLLPDAIVDQHFVKRQRQNRLLGLIIKNPNLLGIGIDEDTAFAVRDNRFAEVIGSGGVMIFDAKKSVNPMRVFWLINGEKFDLEKRKITLK
jgi:cyanophycinase